MFYLVPPTREIAELAEWLFTLAQRAQDPAQLLQARQRWRLRSSSRDPAATREHMEQGLPCTTSSNTAATPTTTGRIRSGCLAFGQWRSGCSATRTRVQRSREAVALGESWANPHARAGAVLRRHAPAVPLRGPAVQESAEGRHGDRDRARAFALASGRPGHAWMGPAEQGARAGGIAQLRQGLTAWAPPGARHHTYHLALLAEALGRKDRSRKAWACWPKPWPCGRHGRSLPRADLHRLQGEFLLRQRGPKSRAEARALALSGSLFSATPSPSPATAGQIAGVAGRAEPEPPVPAARPANRSSPAARGNLRLVHRRVRHPRSPGGEDAARRTRLNRVHRKGMSRPRLTERRAGAPVELASSRA